MAFKLSLIGEAREWFRTTSDVEKSLDDLADSLDQLARDTGDSADKAGTELKREFTDAFDKVKTESKRASDRMGTDIKRGTREAGEGMDGLKEEAQDTAREVAASFDGSAESIIDGFQEVAAQAGAHFGPAGLVAGIAAAGVIGIFTSQLEEAKRKAQETLQRTIDLADELNGVGDKLSELDLESKVRDYLNEASGSGDLTNLELFVKVLPDVDPAEIGRALAGEPAAYDRVTELIRSKIRAAFATPGATVEMAQLLTADLSTVLAKLETPPVNVRGAIDRDQLLDDFTRGVKDAQKAGDLFLRDHPIDARFNVDADALQRDVNRAASRITPPTIYVRTRTRNEVP